MPHYQFEINTNLAPEQVTNRIVPLVHEKKNLFEPVWKGFVDAEKTQAKFIGNVQNASFKIRCYRWRRNSFMAVITGVVRKSNAGSSVRVKMYLHPFVAAFMAVWFMAIGCVAWEMYFSTSFVGRIFCVAPIGLLIFGVYIVIAGFLSEAIRARRILEEAICT
jgi:hypothetical protein